MPSAWGMNHSAALSKTYIAPNLLTLENGKFSGENNNNNNNYYYYYYYNYNYNYNYNNKNNNYNNKNNNKQLFVRCHLSVFCSVYIQLVEKPNLLMNMINSKHLC